jgi:hypothetical protein
MSDVSGISAASNGQYYLRSRQDVQASRTQDPTIIPNASELGRVRESDAATFGDRIKQFTSKVEEVADAIKGNIKVEQPTPDAGKAPGADPGAPQPVESNSNFYTQDDLDAVIANFGQVVGEADELAAYDFDGDGVIGSADLNTILANFVAGV